MIEFHLRGPKRRNFLDIEVFGLFELEEGGDDIRRKDLDPGIDVADAAEAYLYVHVLSFDISRNYSIYKISIEMKQPVVIVVNNKAVTATTWDTGKIGVIDKKKDRDKIRKSVAALVGEFITDYLAANPE